jgi:hypothetical protein
MIVEKETKKELKKRKNFMKDFEKWKEEMEKKS